MSRVLFQEATGDHVALLASRMRQSDRDECVASGFAPEAAIINSMATSVMRQAVFFNGEFAGVFGVCPDPQSTHLAPSCYAWFLSTDVVDKYKKTFFKTSLLICHQLTKQFGRLRNFVDLRYTRSLDWLERTGWKVGPRTYPGPTGLRFVEVTREPWEEV